MEDGGPSASARRVAAHRLEFTRVPAAYGDPAADEALAADVAAGHVALANRMHDYLAARTAFFGRTVGRAVDRGVRQVVIGAAGYDGRAFRYARPGVRWSEVDHPATQGDKLRRLERLGLAAPNVRYVEADFTRDPVASRLRAAGLDAGAPSLFLLEGIAVYLEPAVLESVLEQFREVAAPGSRLAISVSLSASLGDAGRARFQAAVAALGEPTRSALSAAETEALLAQTGWQTDKQPLSAASDRLRSAGLLLAVAGPRASAPPETPRSPRRPSRGLKTPPPHHPHPRPLSPAALRPAAPPRHSAGARCGCGCPASSSSAGGTGSARSRPAGCAMPSSPWSASLIPACPTACPSSARRCLAGDQTRRSRSAPTRPARLTRPACRCRRCCPGSCCPSPWSTSRRPDWPSRSAPTCCAS